MKNNSPSLISQSVDFWVLGGFSVFLWLALFIVYQFGLEKKPSIESQLYKITVLFGGLALFINTPHFFWSFRLAYFYNPQIIKTNKTKLIILPLILVALLISAYVFWDVSTKDFFLIRWVDHFLWMLGFKYRFSFYPSIGRLIIGLLLTVQVITLGWHYSKQAYGIMMVYAAKTQYPLENWQKDLLRYSLFGIWWTYLFDVNAGFKQFQFGAFTYYNLNWGISWMGVSQVYLLFSLLIVGYFVYLKNYVERGVVPHLNMLAPQLASYLWFVPGIYLKTPGYFEFIVPFFHSLQYLAFVYRVETRDFPQSPQKQIARSIVIISSIVLVGFISYDVIPNLMDKSFSPDLTAKVGFFAVAAYLFLNIHHYIIDNAIWTRNQPLLGKVLGP